jgi:hypothetical protein
VGGLKQTTDQVTGQRRVASALKVTAMFDGKDAGRERQSGRPEQPQSL